MNIAILIYGRLNKAIDQYDNIIKHVIGEQNVDIFCSSDNSNNIKEFIMKYNPISYINDEIILDNDILNYYKQFRKPFETNVENAIKHFMNKQRVYQLLKTHIEKTGKKYDIIMSLRVDLQFSSKIIFQYPQKNTIYIPQGKDYRNGINDQIAYGDQNTMEIYNNIISQCNNILLYNLSKCGFHPENLTAANIKLHGLNIHRFPLTYKIVR